MNISRIAFSCAVLVSSLSLAQSSFLSPLPPMNLVSDSVRPIIRPESENQFHPAYWMIDTFSLPRDNTTHWPANLLSVNNKSAVSGKFSVTGVQTEYWIEDGQGQIRITIATQTHLLITIYLYDLQGQEKTQTATLINNRTKDMTLPLDNIAEGNYRLVIKALDVNNLSAIKTFHVALANIAK